MAKAKSATAKVPTKTFHAATNRPTGGKLLFAHTIAVLTVLGMFKGTKRATRTPGALAALMGATALSYHSNEKRGNFGRDENTGRVILTDTGLEVFAARVGRLGFEQSTAQVANNETVKAMVSALKSGGMVEGIKFAKEVAIRW
jgi:uncharacterized membrane protein YebE (DUF533 family)